MSFKSNVPDYKMYSNTELHMNSLPDDIWGSLKVLIRKSAKDADNLKAIINYIAEITGGPLTDNWGWDFLVRDIDDCVYGIRKKYEGMAKKHFESFMDSLAVLHDVGNLTCEEIDEFLEDHAIGYRCYTLFGPDIVWSPIKKTYSINNVMKVQESIKSISEQAFERFSNAKIQFEQSSDERARKEAVRSCIDAMEALIKELGNDDEIGEATKHLKDAKNNSGNPIWGPVQIVKDGNSIFDRMHELYPDVRHGTQDSMSSVMSIEEMEYWVGRITVFMNYMVSRARKLGY